MGYIASTHNPAAAGEVTVEPTVYTEVAASETSGASLTDFNIAAGKRRVVVKNISPLGGGDPLAAATINGNPLIAGHPYEFEQFIDEVAKEVITSPALAIVTDGAYVYYQYYD